MAVLASKPPISTASPALGRSASNLFTLKFSEIFQVFDIFDLLLMICI